MNWYLMFLCQLKALMVACCNNACPDMMEIIHKESVMLPFLAYQCVFMLLSWWTCLVMMLYYDAISGWDVTVGSEMDVLDGWSKTLKPSSNINSKPSAL